MFRKSFGYNRMQKWTICHGMGMHPMAGCSAVAVQNERMYFMPIQTASTNVLGESEEKFLLGCTIPPCYHKLAVEIRKQLARWYDIDCRQISSQMTNAEFVRKCGYSSFFWFKVLSWNIIEFVDELEDALEMQLYYDASFPDLFSFQFSKMCRRKQISASVGNWIQLIAKHVQRESRDCPCPMDVRTCVYS